MPPTIGTLGMITLHVHDFKAALTFYRDALGLKAGDLYDSPQLQWAEFEAAPGVKLGIHADPHGHEPGARPPGGPTGFYFTVPNVDDAIRALRAKGVKVGEEPTDRPYGRDASVLDPDGNEIALVTPN